MKIESLLLFIISFWGIFHVKAQPCVNPTPDNTGSTVGISSVNFESISHNTPLGEGYTVEKDSGASLATVTRGSSYNLNVSGIAFTCANKQANAWIDWNNNDNFDDPGEHYGPVISNSLFYNITIPISATLDTVAMRISIGTHCPSGNNFGPCDTLGQGDVEDYEILIIDSNMRYDSAEVIRQFPANCYAIGNINYILKIPITVSYNLNPQSVTSFQFNTANTTTPSSTISNAQVWYTSNKGNFNPISQFGNTVLNPNGTFIINGNQTLLERGTHYFWLSYTIAPAANTGAIIDASCQQITIDSSGFINTKIPNSIALSSNLLVCETNEICGNSIDDDGNGLIDCFDPQCVGTIDCIFGSDNHFYGNPELKCPQQPITDSVLLSLLWRSEDAFPSRNSSKIIAADIDQDDTIEVITEQPSNNGFRVYNGVTGKHELSVNVSAFQTIPGTADIDGDGFGEFIVSGGGSSVKCFEHDGTLKWSTASIPFGSDASFADFNSDGIPEVYGGTVILNATNGDVLITNVPTGGIAADIFPEHFGLELVAGNAVYSIDLENQKIDLLASFGSMGGFFGIADFNNDSLLDIVILNTLTTLVWDPRTEDTIKLATGTFPKPITVPCIADFDNDGNVEIAAKGLTDFIVLDDDMSLLWKHPVNNSGVNPTPIAFDFQGDNYPEIVYRDQDSLFVFDGSTGKVLDKKACVSATVSEHPIVVDVDNNGSANILCTCQGLTTDNVFAYESGASEKWTSARSVWNQYIYMNTNINDNLSVPIQQQNNARSPGLNNYQTQSPIRDIAGNIINKLIPDLTVNITKAYDACNHDSVIIIANVCNIGDSLVKPGTKLAFYDGNPNISGSLKEVFTINSIIGVDSCLSDTFKIISGSQDIYIYVNDDGLNPSIVPNIKFAECDSMNNGDWITPDTVDFSVSINIDTSICEGTSASLWVQGGVNFIWAPGLSLDDSLSQNPIAKPLTPTMYQVIASDIFNCNDTASVFIDIKSCEIYIPNAFSPNGDGDNDIFKIVSSGINEINIKIYNRWGKKVFETANFNEGWDGTINGHTTNEGVYVYQTIGILSSGEPFNLKGNVTLIK